MNRFSEILITVTLCLVCCGFTQAKNTPANVQPLNVQSFSKCAFVEMKLQKLGERWLMVLWSLDCPACFKELKLMQTLQQKNKDKALNVVFINADDNDEVAFERQQVIAFYEMDSFANFYFIDGQGDASRYQIDPQWYGELPRSYFVNEQGEFHGKSGLLDEALINKWLVGTGH